MIYTESPRRRQINQQVAWGHWFALANIFMAIIIASVYLFATPVANTPISFIFMLTNWLGHISFITFLSFVIIILPLCYLLKNTKMLRGIAAVISALGLALLGFDALVYNNTGFHLSFSSAALLRSETQVQIGAFSWLQWFYLVLLFIVWLMLQLVIANAIHQRLYRLNELKVARYIVTAFVVCFITSHAIHVWADAKLYTPVLKQDNTFPLSYPATAKTLMARYGLLDLADRQQREDLQLQGISNRFIYPPQNVFCSVNSDNKVMVLATTQTLPTEYLSNIKDLANLQSNMFHLNTQKTDADFLQQLKFGIPDNLISRTSSPPVMLDLLEAFSVPHQSYMYSPNNEASQSLWDAFNQSLSETPNGLYLGLLSAEQLQSLPLAELSASTDILLIAQDPENDTYKLYSNFINNTQASTNEDIAPTVMRQFECTAEIYRFSTGQALQSPSRQWLVSTMEDNILYFKAPYLTRVSIDGSYVVTDIRDQSDVLIDIDTNMLSRSIKHLENFAN